MIEIDKKYILRFNIKGKDIVFTAVIESIDDIHIHFKDKYGLSTGYKREDLVSYQEYSYEQSG